MGLVTLTDENFDREALDASLPVLVFCKASWSGTCQIVEPIIATLAADFSEQIIAGTLDIDNNPGAAESYGVSDIPDLLIFQEGELTDRLTGITSRKDLIARINSLINTKP